MEKINNIEIINGTIYQNKDDINHDSYDKICGLLKSAKKNIYISTWISFEDDYFFNTILEILSDKLNDGINVTYQSTSDDFRTSLLLNTVYVKDTKKKDILTIKKLESKGLKFITQKIYSENKISNLTGIHEKIIIVDDKYVYIGSRNLNANYFYHWNIIKSHYKEIAKGFKTKYINFLDSDIFINDETLAKNINNVYNLKKTYYEDNNFTFTRNIPIGNSTNNSIEDEIIKLIKSAKQEILFINMDFILSNKMLTALADNKNIKIKIYTNGLRSYFNFPFFISIPFLYTYDSILGYKTKYRFITNYDYYLHSKLFLFDNKILCVGSFNIDPCSYIGNTESLLTIKDIPNNVADNIKNYTKELDKISQNNISWIFGCKSINYISIIIVKCLLFLYKLLGGKNNYDISI